VPGWVSAAQAHSRVSNIKLIFEKKIVERYLYKYAMKNILRTAQFLPTWGLRQRYFPCL
jgi:hypothetical protein